MLYDCAIIGGGPAGLNAALVLGRARRNVIVYDSNKPRNAVTHESHGFLTRDGVKPAEFRRIAQSEIVRYPSVHMQQAEVNVINRTYTGFEVITAQGERVEARKIILATGLKEVFPEIRGLSHFYGKSLFNCPYCDGWELRDKPLIIVAEGPHLFHGSKLISNWSRDLIICTNGHRSLTPEQIGLLEHKGMRVMQQPITSFEGKDGQLEHVVFADGTRVRREGGFVTPKWVHAAPFGERLGCFTNDMGGIVTDGFGRTNVKDVYAAGDASVVAPSQLIIAAAEGSRAAIGLNGDLTEEMFMQW
ncbi:NAD(P)/FAD-dependent oxidoreductase [Paenibacillus sp. UNC451MF]|uniref:NAD(P)/FAD-dependent oxidoreductase n=1 Tax=Paenibacillus sp. UNC451MF TaxID=1449063 RepID=UPI000490F7EA|nr:NAD(P)/FAD-dependent oxidoreductase [Paenibacillus sp. UNC451MF]